MEMLVLMGAPGAGKSTFLRERFFDTHVRINLDMLRTRHRERALLDACLCTRQPVAIDNTNPTRAQRAVYLVRAREHGFAVYGYRFHAPLDVLRERNGLRSGKARVPDVAILATLKAFEPPVFAEGFDRLFEVEPAPDGYRITEVADEI